MTHTWLKRIGTGLLLCSALMGCDIDKTQEGEMPEVDVKGGKLPKYDVEGPEVEVRSETREVEVPDVDIRTEKKQVEVPNVDIDLPNDDE